MRNLIRWTALAVVVLYPAVNSGFADEHKMNSEFETLAARYVDEFPALSPVSATGLGDHRFDHLLDDVSHDAVEKRIRWTRGFLRQLNAIDPARLTRSQQVDFAVLKHNLDGQLWKLTVLREWEWNPIIYTGLSGSAVYNLMARQFAPARQRLNRVCIRLEQFPVFLKQVRNVLDISKVPQIHAKTAAAQNRGVLKTIDNMVRPLIDSLPETERKRLIQAIETAQSAIAEHQRWMDSELVPRAAGSQKLGIERYEKKLSYTLHSSLTHREIRDLADRRVSELHTQMYDIAKQLYRTQYPLTAFPERPTSEFQRVVIRFGLEKAYAQASQKGEIVATAERSLKQATEFIRKKDLVTILPDPLKIIVMPEFQRGVSLAYCDAPGPLETGQTTFYAVSPIPADWTEQQTQSHLREYNRRSIDVLTIHEAMPGHFLQLAHANRYSGKLRHLLQSGVFVEGWAVYTEWMMCEEGYLDHDPLLKLITLKWYLRDVVNAILDHSVHVDGISRDEGMRLMVEDAFQEEREAAGKWTRAQLTSTQLSTYFVGYLEHVAMRRRAEQKWADKFDLKTYHDTVLSFGSPPPKFVQALLLEETIPLPAQPAGD